MFSKGARILIVDDVEMINDFVTTLLSELGYKEVDVAEDGEQAWSMIWDAYLSQKSYELIISDVMMPKMTGLELLRKIRATPETMETAFIVISADIHSAKVQEAIQAGCSQYVSKPFNSSTLIEKMKSAYKLSQSKKIKY